MGLWISCALFGCPAAGGMEERRAWRLWNANRRLLNGLSLVQLAQLQGGREGCDWVWRGRRLRRTGQPAERRVLPPIGCCPGARHTAQNPKPRIQNPEPTSRIPHATCHPRERTLSQASTHLGDIVHLDRARLAGLLAGGLRSRSRSRSRRHATRLLGPNSSAECARNRAARVAHHRVLVQPAGWHKSARKIMSTL